MKNSAGFSSFIAGQTLSPEMALVSFDVMSLFTRVPTALAVRVALDRLKADPSLCERTALSPAEVTSLLTFCLDATYLFYRGGLVSTDFRDSHGVTSVRNCCKPCDGGHRRMSSCNLLTPSPILEEVHR